jgi:flagellar biosynthesis/type III secretory pathway protein FliH
MLKIFIDSPEFYPESNLSSERIGSGFGLDPQKSKGYQMDRTNFTESKSTTNQRNTYQAYEEQMNTLEKEYQDNVKKMQNEEQSRILQMKINKNLKEAKEKGINLSEEDARTADLLSTFNNDDY